MSFCKTKQGRSSKTTPHRKLWKIHFLSLNKNQITLLLSTSHYWSQKQNLDQWIFWMKFALQWTDNKLLLFLSWKKIDVLKIIWLSSLWKMSVNKEKKSFKVCGFQYCYMLGQMEPFFSFQEKRRTENSIETKWFFVNDKLMCRLLGSRSQFFSSILKRAGTHIQNDIVTCC